MSKTYWLDTDNHGGVYDYTLYEKVVDDDGFRTDKAILQFNAEDVPGLKDSEDTWETIEDYIEDTLGFRADFEVN